MALVVVLLIAMAMVQLSHAAVYKVGDSAGWTIIGNVDYKQWAATKNFKVGDTIIFQYNAQFHNVMRVNHTMYKACNASAPLATFTTGRDSINITTHGHHYFLCGVPGHCQAGQKVDINVIRASAMSPTPSMESSPSLVPALAASAPSPNNAPSFKGSLIALTILGVFVIYVLGLA